MWNYIIPAAASLIGGLLSNAESGGSAKGNQDFQAYQSATAYRRGMYDMKEAGLNPMLAYSQGGASVPTGATYTAQNVGASAAQAFSAAQSSQAAAQSVDQAAPVQAATARNIEAQTKTEGFRAAIAHNDAIKGNYALMELAGTLDAAMKMTGGLTGQEAIAKLSEPRIAAGLMELRAALASAKNDAQVFEALNSKAVNIALDVLGKLTGSGNAIAGAVDRYRARSQRGDIINLNKE